MSGRCCYPTGLLWYERLYQLNGLSVPAVCDREVSEELTGEHSTNQMHVECTGTGDQWHNDLTLNLEITVAQCFLSHAHKS